MMDKKVSELKVATIMFVDISGFTSVSEKLPPEEVSSLINTYFEKIGYIIKLYDGSIDKYIGDCVMALFGVPSAIEHGPEKAVLAALKIKKELEGFNKDLNLGIHIGINTGEVLAGLVGVSEQKDYTVIGDSVNIASRIEDYAENGQILVGADTWSKTKDKFIYNELEPINVKGKSEAISVYEVIKEVEEPCEQEHSVLIGRDHELDRLELHLLRIKDGEGSIVNVIGEAGIGKTRLIEELKSLHAIKNVTILEGDILQIGKNLSFYPIIKVLKKWASIGVEDNDLTASNKLYKRLMPIFNDKSEEVLSYILIFMGIKLPGKFKSIVDKTGFDTEKIIVRYIKELLISISKEKPLVLVFEDLHWADQSSISLLIELFRLANNYSILFINIFRPNYKDTSNIIVEAVNQEYCGISETIELKPLEGDNVELLVNNLLLNDSHNRNIRDWIKERCGGNPYFVEEVVRFVHGNNSIIDIPNTVQEIIMSRIDTLDHETKELLKVASVIGQSFFKKILYEMLGRNDSVEGNIELLESVQLIKQRKRMEEVEYIFEHALARDAIYNSILLKDRKELHFKTAVAIENIFKEKLHNFYGFLAYHYELAENMEKAEEYMTKAGEEALNSTASSEAITYLQKAIDLSSSKVKGENDFKLLGKKEVILAKAYSKKGLYNESVEYYDLALKHLGIIEPENKIVLGLSIIKNVILLLKEIYYPRKNRKEPDDNLIYMQKIYLDRCFNLLQTDPVKCIWVALLRGSELSKYKLYTSQVMLNSFCGLVHTFWLIGSHRIMKRLLDYIKKYHLQKGKVLFYPFNYAQLVYDVTTKMEANCYSEEYFEEILKSGDFNAAFYSYQCFAMVFFNRGNYSAYRAIIEKFEHFINTYNLQGQEIDLNIIKASYYNDINELEEGFKYIELAIDKAKKINSNLGLFTCYGYKLWLEIKAGNIVGANIIKDKIMGMYKKMKHIASTDLAMFYIALFVYDLKLLELALSKNNSFEVKRIKSRIDRSLKKIDKISRKWFPIKMEALMLIGHYYVIIGKKKKVINWYLKAIDFYKMCGSKPHLAAVYRELGEYLLELDKISKIENRVNKTSGSNYLSMAEQLNLECEIRVSLW